MILAQNMHKHGFDLGVRLRERRELIERANTKTAEGPGVIGAAGSAVGAAWKSLAATSLLLGIPVGTALHLIGNDVSSTNAKADTMNYGADEYGFAADELARQLDARHKREASRSNYAENSRRPYQGAAK